MKARNILILLAGLLTLPLYFGGCAVDRWEAYAGRTQTDRWIDDTMRVWYYWKQDISPLSFPNKTEKAGNLSRL